MIPNVNWKNHTNLFGMIEIFSLEVFFDSNTKSSGYVIVYGNMSFISSSLYINKFEIFANCTSFHSANRKFIVNWIWLVIM